LTLLITGGTGYLGGELVRQSGAAAAHPRLELLDPLAVPYRQDDPRVNAAGSAAVAHAAAEVGAG